MNMSLEYLKTESGLLKKKRFLSHILTLSIIPLFSMSTVLSADGVKTRCEFEEYTSAGGLQTKTTSKNYCERNSGSSAEAKCEADIEEWCVMGKDNSSGRLRGCFYKPGSCRCRPVSNSAECPSDISKTFENFSRTAYKWKLQLFTSDDKIRSDAPVWRSAYSEDSSSDNGDSETKKLNRRKAEMKNTASLYEGKQNEGLEAKKQAYRDAVAANERAAAERRRRRQQSQQYNNDSGSSYSDSGSSGDCQTAQLSLQTCQMGEMYGQTCGEFQERVDKNCGGGSSGNNSSSYETSRSNNCSCYCYCAVGGSYMYTKAHKNLSGYPDESSCSNACSNHQSELESKYQGGINNISCDVRNMSCR